MFWQKMCIDILENECFQDTHRRTSLKMETTIMVNNHGLHKQRESFIRKDDKEEVE